MQNTSNKSNNGALTLGFFFFPPQRAPSYICPSLEEEFISSFLKNNFAYFWLCWVFYPWEGFSPVAESWGYSLVVLCELLIAMLLWLQSTAPGHAGFGSCSSGALEHKHNSCEVSLKLVRFSQTRDIDPSPASAGRFFTTEPPGNPHY